MPRQRYHLRVADVATARGSDPDLAFAATEPRRARATPSHRRCALRRLFERWRAKQPEPDEVDARSAPSTRSAEARAGERAHDVELVVTTSLPHSILRSGWTGCSAGAGGCSPT